MMLALFTSLARIIASIPDLLTKSRHLKISISFISNTTPTLLKKHYLTRLDCMAQWLTSALRPCCQSSMKIVWKKDSISTEVDLGIMYTGHA